MNNKKVIVFVYDFPHRKSLSGMQIIKNSGIENVLVISQPWIKLTFRKSKNRISVIEDEFTNPTDLARSYGWEVLTSMHNSKEAIDFYSKINPDYGVILGARILSKSVINCFSEGIINFHRGLLPNNRGLDTIKWAIYNRLPQGITTHMIDEKIDVGKKIYLETIDVEKEDTIFDVDSKLFYLEMKHLNKVLNDEFQFPKLENLESSIYTKSQDAVSDEIDDQVLEDFELYKKNYKKILSDYKYDNKNQ